MIAFSQPLWLLALLPTGWYMWSLAKHSLADMSTFQRRLSMGLRVAILLMLVFVLAGASTVRSVTRQCVVFVLDNSDSIPATKQQSALGYVRKALNGIKPDQKAGLVVFGGDAVVELAPSEAARIDEVYSVPKKDQTDISQAIGLALALFPEAHSKKIVLLSDGNETRGRALEQAALAGSTDVSIDVVPMIEESTNETLLDGMTLPGTVKIGEPFDLKIVAQSTGPAQARVRLLRNGAPVESRVLDITKGKSIVSFRQTLDSPGSYEFKAILDCAADTRSENNVALGCTFVFGKPRLLYVEGKPGQSEHLTKALSGSSITLVSGDRFGIPRSLSELRNYDMVVLSDVPAWQMTPEQMAMIRSGVKDLGIGLTMIGGDNGFGAGGYFDTPIEEALPVEMSLKKQKIVPSLAVVVVMDKSGSMGAIEGGVEKIRLANDAAASVVKLLQPIDQVAVVVCHDFPVAAVSLTRATNKDHIYDEISTIRAEGGGIVVYPSMQMAAGIIKQTSTRLKHIILLADGADCDEPEGTVALALALAKIKVTVTTVAFGEGKDLQFLKAVAAAGRGGFYLARRAADLKAIFTKDVMTMAKSVIVEEPFLPRADANSPELVGIDPKTIPPLLGYVATTAKPAAAVSMVSHKGDPILASWQFGLGRSSAFTSDCKARWAAHWLEWSGYTKIWAQLIRSTMRKSGSSDLQTAVDIENGLGSLGIDAVDAQGNFINSLEFAGSVVGPDMTSQPLRIDQTGPGRYEATFDASKVGNYAVSVVRKGTSTAPDVNIVSISYPTEYLDTAPNIQLLERIAEETNGVVDPAPGEVFQKGFRKTRAVTDLWRLLVLLSIVLLPLDLAVRRLAISPQQALELGHIAIARLSKLQIVRERAKSAEEATPAGALLTSKRQRKEAQRAARVVPGTTPTESPQPLSPSPAKPVAPDGKTVSQLLKAKKKRGGDT